ncbi:MAG: tetratricopeptide repeat protein [bacterium]
MPSLALIILLLAPPPEALPPIPDADASAEARSAAQAENTAGFRAWKAGRHVQAARHYRAALGLDPAYHLARYNLACVWARLGKSTDALAILAAFKAKGCTECLARVERSRSDPDWKTLWKDPRYQAIAGAAPSPVEAAARAVEAAFLTGKSPELKDFLGTKPVVTQNICSVCDDDMPTPTRAVPPAELAKWLGQWAKLAHSAEDMGEVIGFEGMTCDATCCRTRPRETLMHMTQYLERVCVEPAADGKVTLTAIDVMGG